MNQYTYDFEIQTMVTMFINAMSDIVIKRFNVHKSSENQIKTRIVYAPKQRVLNDLLNRDQNLVLPVMACYIGGIARDQGRVFNKIVGSFNKLDDGRVLNEKQPLPIDLTINVSVMTRYQSDMDQILSHLIPYINPYFAVSWRTPARPDFEIRSNVFWNGSVNVQYPTDLQANQVARCVADLSFVFKGWVFQAVPTENVGNIYTINSSYVNDPKLEYYDTKPYSIYKDELTSSDDNYDFIQYKAVPPKPKVIEPHQIHVNKYTQINLFGTGFKNALNVYLSGSPVKNASETFSPFSSLSALSAANPSFFAYKLPVTDWRLVEDQHITLLVPSLTSTGNVDVIIEGPAGYGTLTQGVRINSYNPFATLPLLSSIDFTPYQVPYVSGIAVIDQKRLLTDDVVEFMPVLSDGIDHQNYLFDVFNDV